LFIRFALVSLTMWCVGAGARACETPRLLGLDGLEHALDDYVGRGQWVMVNVWSPGCEHCLTELPALRNVHRGDDPDVLVLGLAVAYPGFGYPDRNTLDGFVKANGVDFPVLLADGKAASAFVDSPIDVVPITFAFDPRGRMVAQWYGVITLPDIREIIRDFTAR